MSKKKTVLVDCDTGVDDAVALLYLLLDPEVEVCGITTVFGNVSSADAARNSLAVLEVAGKGGEVPVARGADVTLLGEIPELSHHVHGANGLGDIEVPEPKQKIEDESAAEMIVRMARQRPGEIHLVPVGPLTNLALALGIEPRLPQLIEGVTIMGGAADAPGNVTPSAEANIWHDPEAAQAVFNADWKTTLVPLDATMREILTEDQRRQLVESDAAPARFAGQILDFYFEFYRSIYGERCSACHDALAAAIAVGDVVPKRAMTVGVAVDTGYGPGRGATICDTRGQYKNEQAQEGARHRVVLETGGDFSARIVERLTGGVR